MRQTQHIVPTVYTFFAELSRFDIAITMCYNVCESKRKEQQGDCRPFAARCDNLSILHHYTTSKTLTCQDFLQGIASFAQKNILTEGQNNDDE